MMSRGVAAILGLLLLQLHAAEPDKADPAPEQPAQAGQPRLVCPEPTYDFGTREPSDAVVHEFVLRNEGDGPLLITQVKPACGCTVVDWKTMTLKPGEETRLKCRLRLKGYKGAQQKSIRIHSNDPTQPIRQLWFKGNVSVDVELTPSFISFSQLQHTALVTRKVRLTSVGRVVQVTDVTCLSRLFDVAVQTVDGLAADIVITTRPPLPPGTHRTRIVVKTDDAKYPELYLPVVVSVLSEVAVMPQVIYLPRPAAGQGLTRSILLRPSTVARFKILRVETPHEDIRSAVIPVRGGIQRVELRNIPMTGEMDGKEVRIFTDLEIMDEIRVPFRVAR